jgi:uncharacterized small protein (DUF1192 family)
VAAKLLEVGDLESRIAVLEGYIEEWRGNAA